MPVFIMDDQPAEKRKYSKHDFYFETPLYEFIDIDQIEGNLLSGSVDAYNPTSGYDTTYEIHSDQVGYGWSGFLKVTLTCKRNGKDFLRFFIYYGDIVFKVGQWPTLADIQFAELGKKYDKVLPDSDLQEFKRAIGLFAHGVGVGAFVYLRRIFENLIQETFGAHSAEVACTEEDFKKLRMDDKVNLLKPYLPTQLVEMRDIYKVLSTGVHKLDEATCMAFFPAVKLAIELILDQKIDMRQKALRDKEVKDQLKAITGSLT